MLPIIVFFSALISLLYYIGVMQWVIKIIGGRYVVRHLEKPNLCRLQPIFLLGRRKPVDCETYISRMTESEPCGDVWRFGVNRRIGIGRLCRNRYSAYLLDRRFLYGGCRRGLLFAKILASRKRAVFDDSDGQR